LLGINRLRSDETLKFGGEFRRIQSNGPLDFTVNGLYRYQDLSPFGFPAHSDNPALEFFLRAQPLSYVGANPSMSNSDRGYRQSAVSGFAQDYVRITRRLTLNVGLRYDFYSNPSKVDGRISAIRNPVTDSGPTVGKVSAGTPIVTAGGLRMKCSDRDQPQATDHCRLPYRSLCVLPGALTLKDGFEVFVVGDACGGLTPQSHEFALRRLEQAGARLTSWIQALLEFQRDWTRHETYEAARAVVEANGGGYGIGLAYAREMIHPG
jgi:hypothetical protein